MGEPLKNLNFSLDFDLSICLTLMNEYNIHDQCKNFTEKKIAYALKRSDGTPKVEKTQNCCVKCQCKVLTSLREWFNAIVTTLPKPANPPPQPPMAPFQQPSSVGFGIH